MKINCPGHNGPIDVLNQDIFEAVAKPAKLLVVPCVICEEDVLISILELESTSYSSGN